jgi:hypothetical protein
MSMMREVEAGPTGALLQKSFSAMFTIHGTIWAQWRSQVLFCVLEALTLSGKPLRD